MGKDGSGSRMLAGAAGVLLAACGIACSLQSPWVTSKQVSATAAAEIKADPARVREVLEGKRRTANAAWWGFDPEDATAALQGAFDSPASLVIVPDTGSPWMVGPLRLRGGLRILFLSGVVVQAKTGAFRNRGDCLLNAEGADDLVLDGYGASLRMRKDEYTRDPYEPSEWRHAISLRSCSRVRILGLTIESSGGDGIYIGRGGSDHPPFCEDVEVRDVRLLDHHRQGISVVSVRRLLVEHCLIAGTRGTPPQAGIDFEPNRGDEYLQECVIRQCRVESNAGAGIQVYLAKLNEASYPVSIRIESTEVRSNFLQFFINPAGGKPRGAIRFIDTKIGFLSLLTGADGFAIVNVNKEE